MKFCLFCGMFYETSPYKNFCSKRCYNKSVRKLYVCHLCGKEWFGASWPHKKRTGLCPDCLREGEYSPTWKGGHKYWIKGKLGRDNFTCQKCNKTREELGRNPDCHHVKPYRLCFSHALDNLLSLCRKCHKQEEAKIKELWGGVVLGEFINKN